MKSGWNLFELIASVSASSSKKARIEYFILVRISVYLPYKEVGIFVVACAM
jgi:hypothetical protein